MRLRMLEKSFMKRACKCEASIDSMPRCLRQFLIGLSAEALHARHSREPVRAGSINGTKACLGA